MDDISKGVQALKDKLEAQCNYLRIDKDSPLRSSVDYFKNFKDFFGLVCNAIPKEQKKRGGAAGAKKGGGGMSADLMAELQAAMAKKNA